VWLVADPEASFALNVNVLTQAAPGMDLAGYLELSIDNAPLLLDDFELLDESIVESDAGQGLAVMEYAGADLQYLGVFAIDSGQAIVATLTAPTHRFNAIRDSVMPYLLTLKLPDPL